MSVNSPKVFVVHENMDMNFTDAERFGEIVFVNNREWNPRRGSLSNQDTLERIRVVLRTSFNPERDYLILNGPPVLLGYAFHWAARVAEDNGVPGLRMLTWDKFARKYIEGVVEGEL